jgi:hypothetical protein
MRPFVRSYGESSSSTRSPGRIRMRWRRKRPAMCARTTWPLSSSTEKVALGKTCLILPITSSGASLTFCAGFAAFGRRARVLFFRLRTGMDDTPFIYSLPSELPIAASRRIGFAVGLALDGWDEGLKIRPIFQRRNFLDQAKDRALVARGLSHKFGPRARNGP